MIESFTGSIIKQLCARALPGGGFGNREGGMHRPARLPFLDLNHQDGYSGANLGGYSSL